EPLGGGTVVTIGPLGTIQGFTISGGFAEFGGGMWVSGAGTVVKQDVFYANTEMIGGLGAAIFGGDASPIVEQDVFQANHCDDTQFGFGVVSFVNLSSPRFDNDVFDDNNCRAVSLALSRGSDPVVVNDTIVRNAGGLFIDDYAATAGQVFRNDIVVDNTVGVQSDSKGQNYSFDHNDVYGNTTDYGGLPDQTGLNGNISADPLFAGSLADDFELSSGSPAIGVGSPVDAPTVDFNGDPRPPGSIDLGAFQTQPSISAQLAGLREAVDGLHGGHALARLVTGAEQAFEIGDIPAACQDIKKFVFLEHRVGGSTIPRSVRTQLADAARRIESDLAC
ncbi:MAG TPA: choice-of-anchor Q domain-containing protein, partial [Acidimicrobiales bacterium]|nr:choice-of-anchor Q domain-containing protein [Acidimicrobiales bacterium]